MSDPKAAQLVAVAALIRERELAALAALARRRTAEETRLRDMRAEQTRAIASAAPDPAHFCGADEAWLRWNAQRLQDQAVRAAQSAADMEAQLTNARKAFGRADALNRILSVPRR